MTRQPLIVWRGLSRVSRLFVRRDDNTSQPLRHSVFTPTIVEHQPLPQSSTISHSPISDSIRPRHHHDSSNGSNDAEGTCSTRVLWPTALTPSRLSSTAPRPSWSATRPTRSTCPCLPPRPRAPTPRQARRRTRALRAPRRRQPRRSPSSRPRVVCHDRTFHARSGDTDEVSHRPDALV